MFYIERVVLDTIRDKGVTMALVPCAQCRQPFYASCHDASCIGAVCPYCEYAEILPEETYGDAASPIRYHLDGQPAQSAKPDDRPHRPEIQPSYTA